MPSPNLPLVQALYELLHDAYLKEYGQSSVTPSPRERVTATDQLFRVPANFLLPVKDEWTYDPFSDAPYPITTPVGLKRLPDSPSLDCLARILKFGEVPGLKAVNERIFQRSCEHRLHNHASQILSLGIQQTKREIACLENPQEKSEEIDYEDKAELNVKLRLNRLRLHWLEMWDKSDQDYRREVRQASEVHHGSRVSSDNYDRLIKPGDVYKAAEELHKHFDVGGLKSGHPYTEAENETRRSEAFAVLGSWYVYIMRLCGANRGQIAAMRDSHAEPSDGDDKNKAWTRLVKRRYDDGVATLDDKPEDN